MAHLLEKSSTLILVGLGVDFCTNEELIMGHEVNWAITKPTIKWRQLFGIHKMGYAHALCSSSRCDGSTN